LAKKRAGGLSGKDRKKKGEKGEYSDRLGRERKGEVEVECRRGNLAEIGLREPWAPRAVQEGRTEEQRRSARKSKEPSTRGKGDRRNALWGT